MSKPKKPRRGASKSLESRVFVYKNFSLWDVPNLPAFREALDELRAEAAERPGTKRKPN